MRVRGVLDDAVRVHQIEAVRVEWQLLPVGLTQVGGEPLLREVLSCERDRGRRDVDAGHLRAAAREANQVRSRPAPDLENLLAVVAAEVDQPWQVVQFLEVVLIEVLEEPGRADGMLRDFEIVYVTVPVLADVGCGGGARR